MADNRTMIDDIIDFLGEDFKEPLRPQLSAVMKNCEGIAKSVSSHPTLPISFQPFVVTATVMAFRRLGHEGMLSRNEIGVSTSYADATEYLKKQLGLRKNAGSVGGRGRV